MEAANRVVKSVREPYQRAVCVSRVKERPPWGPQMPDSVIVCYQIIFVVYEGAFETIEIKEGRGNSDNRRGLNAASARFRIVRDRIWGVGDYGKLTSPHRPSLGLAQELFNSIFEGTDDKTSFLLSSKPVIA